MTISWHRKQSAHTATINDTQVTVEPGETLLQAALREGIAFPNSCRVGGCGACKCRLKQGQVKELTETGYLLSAEEIEDGTILACQSVPRSDVSLQVALAHARQQVSGHVASQARLTHDITHLRVKLDKPLGYRAGQFARVSLEGLEGVSRSYSFASPCTDDGEVDFFIRHVPGGVFSSVVHDEDVVGRRVDLEGPSGDFWLRDGAAPLLLIAGGSGLAPVLALLQDALSSGATGPATLLFGAREARDLYALEEIEALAAQWPSSFEFVPVLSEADEDAEWTGARGLVTEHIPEVIAAHPTATAHAYMCGPPAMVDAAIAALEERGVSRQSMHFDRFTTQAELALGADAELAAPSAREVFEAAAREQASEEARTSSGGSGLEALVHLLHYLKYFSFHAVGLFCALSLLAGGAWISAGLVVVVAFYVLGDAFGGDDVSTPNLRYGGILTAQLWLALPLIATIAFVSVWSVSSGDFLGFGQMVTGLSGYDVLAARAATNPWHHLAGVLTTGLMIGLVGTIPAHELTHRTWDPISMALGRWMLAFSFDTIFSIEHVYGHHRYVSTTHDPATAPRGRNVYAHVVISTVKGNISAWEIECERLKNKRLPIWSWHNAVIRGHLMSVLLVVAAGFVGGPLGAAYFTLCALWGKALLEIVNYMEHYGMVRDPETPVQPHHSWNTNRRLSSWTTFNLTRHSHHHAQGEVPYQDLRPYPDAPMMIGGYLTTIIVALIPPLWHHLMTPKILDWDRRFATPEERRLAAIANSESGIPALMDSPLEPVPAT